MFDLVTKNEQGDLVTTSLAIAEGVERPHKNIIELIRQNIESFEGFGPLAFETRKGQALPQGGFAKPTEVALLNEHHATLLLTFMRNIGVVKEFKIRLVREFYKMRDELRNRSQAVDNLSRLDILQMAMQSEEERLRLEQQNRALEQRAADDAPRVAFARQVEVAPDAISVAKAAKILGTGQRRLFAYLRQIGWVSRRNEPYQSKIEAGYLDVKLGSWDHPDHGLQQSVTALITGKGLAKLEHMRQQTKEIA